MRVAEAFVALALLLTPPAVAASQRTAPPRAPVCFEENRGQTSPEADYLARCRGCVAFLTRGGATFATRSAAFRLRFEGARPETKPRPLAPSPGRSNYFIGDDPSRWATDVPRFEGVVYESLLPGVDVRWRGAGTGVAYDLLLAPGVDPADVRLHVEGAASAALDAKGDVVLELAGGRATMSAPRAFQDVEGARRPVAAAFALGADGEVRFRVGPHDATKALVVDPTINVSTYLGGTAYDYAYGLALDAAQALYVTGDAQSTNFPTTSGAYQASNPIPSQAYAPTFVAKFAAGAGSLVYATYLGGTNNSDSGRGIAVDSTGAVFVSGRAQSTNFPLVNPLRTSGPGYLAKLSPSGSAVAWSTYVPYGTPLPGLQPVRLDGSGGLYLLEAGHVLKYVPATPSLAYDRDLTGGGTKSIADIAVDASGQVWAVGSNSVAGEASAGALQGAKAVGTDAWLVRLDASGAVAYQTYLGGAGSDQALDIALTAWGDLFVAGTTTSTDFPLLRSPQSAVAGVSDVWLARLNPAGTALTWCRYFGGAESENLLGMALDGTGRTALVGMVFGSGIPTLDAFQSSYRGGQEGWVAGFASDGSLEYASFLGGSGNEQAQQAVFDAAGRLVVAGATSSTDFPTTASPYQASSAGAFDAFVTRINATASTYTDLSPLVLAPTTIGPAISRTLSVGGGAAPFTWSAYTSPPAGLTVSSSGVLSGTPPSIGDLSFFARVVDAAGVPAIREFRLHVNPPPSIPPTTLPAWTVGRPYSADFAVTGGTAPFSWTLKTGTLPPGSTVDSVGRLTASSLTATGTYGFVVQLFDAAGVGAEGAVSMTVNPTPAIVKPDSFSPSEFRPYGVQFEALSGTPPFSWSVVAGTAPILGGFDAAGVLTGTARAAGDYAFTVRATDAAGATADRGYVVTVAAAPFIETTELPRAARNRPYSVTLAEAGGVPPLSWSADSLPPGMSIRASDGLLSGAPPTAGRRTIACRCTDRNGVFDERVYPFVVADVVDLGRRAGRASWTADFKDGAPTTHALELLAGTELSVVVARTRRARGAIALDVQLLDEDQIPIDLTGVLAATSSRVSIAKFVVPTSGRYFLEAAPRDDFVGSAKVRIAAKPRTRWSGTATLAVGGTATVDLSAPPGARLLLRVSGPKGGSSPTIVGLSDAAGGDLFAAAKRRETSRGATLAVRAPAAGGDLSFEIGSRTGVAGDVFWSVVVRPAGRAAFALPDVAVGGR